MIKNHKWKAIISSVVILLPIVFGVVFWNELPDTMVSHWGADGVADGSTSKAFMVFGMPLILLALQWLLLWLTTVLEKGNRPQSDKVMAMAYGIIPALSLLVHVFIYSIALEKEWNMFALLPLFLGAVFMVIGNYMPKTTRNRTAGIKLSWTLGNDENWNKTHRLGGRIYFWGGLAVMATALLSVEFVIGALIGMILVSVIVPIIYSYSIYKKHKAEGIEYEPVFNRKSDKAAKRITAVFVPLILVGVAFLMFTGDIEIQYHDADFQIVASYADDLTIRYEDVDSIEYRENFNVGFREMGFASVRLSLGTFKNDEYGRYTLYAYAQGSGAVVLRQGDQVLVIVGETADETFEIYTKLAEKIS